MVSCVGIGVQRHQLRPAPNIQEMEIGGSFFQVYGFVQQSQQQVGNTNIITQNIDFFRIHSVMFERLPQWIQAFVGIFHSLQPLRIEKNEALLIAPPFFSIKIS